MKQMKFLVAILAIAFVVGSSFKSHKKFTSVVYGMQTNGTQLASPNQNWTEFQLVNYADVTGEACSTGGSTRCSITLDDQNIVAPNDVIASPTSDDYANYNFIKTAVNGVVQTIQIKLSGSGTAPLSPTYGSASANKVFTHL